jgi:phospholipid/cholesterol/gamma-HCH transport system ATP-binding protein
MIEIKKLSKSFSDNVLFDALDLTVQKGEKVAIIGPSGCGKSTILRYLLGLDVPDGGEILIDGQNILDIKGKDLMDLRLRMGMLFQSAALFDSLTVQENIAFPLIENYGYTMGSAMKKINYVLELVGLEGYNNKMPYQLSGGQKKRIALARAIITDPECIFYDEPTTGLDPIMSTNIENVIVRLNQVMSITCIVVSHQHSTILRTTDQIYMLHQSKLLEPETPDSIQITKNQVIKQFMSGELTS